MRRLGKWSGDTLAAGSEWRFGRCLLGRREGSVVVGSLQNAILKMRQDGTLEADPMGRVRMASPSAVLFDDNYKVVCGKPADMSNYEVAHYRRDALLQIIKEHGDRGARPVEAQRELDRREGDRVAVSQSIVKMDIEALKSEGWIEKDDETKRWKCLKCNSA